MEARQRVKLTSTNSSIGLIVLITSDQPARTACWVTGLNQFSRTSCISPTWWLLRGGCTRSHPELGSETPQRRWYSVSRRGRVGRCQVCRMHAVSHHTPSKSPVACPGNGALCVRGGDRAEHRRRLRPMAFTPRDAASLKAIAGRPGYPAWPCPSPSSSSH